MDILYKEESYSIMGACFEVYKEMGCGMKERVYHECLEREFRSKQLPAVHEPKVQLAYKGETLSQQLIPDFIAYQKIIIELKAEKKITDQHRAQVHHYLRATGFKLGLLVNFGHHPRLEWERIVLDTYNPNSPPQDLPKLQG